MTHCWHCVCLATQPALSTGRVDPNIIWGVAILSDSTLSVFKQQKVAGLWLKSIMPGVSSPDCEIYCPCWLTVLVCVWFCSAGANFSSSVHNIFLLIKDWWLLSSECHRYSLMRSQRWLRYYLNQCWSKSMLAYGVTRPQCVNSQKTPHGGSEKLPIVFHRKWTVLQWIMLY